MKIVKYIGFVYFILVFGSCENKDQTVNFIRIQNVDFSPCSSDEKSKVESNNQQADDGQSIKFVAISSNSLRVEQKMIANCCMEKFEVQLPINKNDSIFINEYTKGESCNCLCLTETCFDLVDLIENTSYVFSIKKNDLDYFTCKVVFTSNTNESFLIN